MEEKTFFSRIRDFFVLISKPINATVNLILLTIVFFIGVGLTSLISKIFRKSFLDLKLEEKKSYWLTKNLKVQKLEKYHRMF